MRITVVVLALILAVTGVSTAQAVEPEVSTTTTAATIQKNVITDVWGRFDSDIGLYHKPAEGDLRISFLGSILLSYTDPGDGFTPSFLAGLQIGDRHVDFAPLGGLNLLEHTPRGLVGWRFWGRFPHHAVLWNETLFYAGKNSQKVLTQLELAIPITTDHRLELGPKILLEGDPKNPHEDLAIMGGGFIQSQLVTKKSGNWLTRILLSAAYKIGVCMRGSGPFTCHELEAEIIIAVTRKPR
jgi:hypothetical protein